MSGKDYLKKIDEIIVKIKSLINDDDDIKFLKDENVIKWLFGVFDFLDNEDQKSENEWGRKLMKKDKQWTNQFGELILKEILILCGIESKKPEQKENFILDLESEQNIFEVKTGTYFTPGTAGEKILGVPFKYCDVPKLFNKKLLIVCFGGAEKQAVKYGIFPNSTTNSKKKFLNFYKERNIKYVKATSLIEKLINQN